MNTLQTKTKNWVNFAALWDVQEPKSFQLQGGKAPLTSHQGLCPWTPLGTPPPDPRYRLALHALAMVRPPLPQILDPPLMYTDTRFIFYYLRRRLASGEGIVSLGVTQCVCPPSRDCMAH